MNYHTFIIDNNNESVYNLITGQFLSGKEIYKYIRKNIHYTVTCNNNQTTATSFKYVGGTIKDNDIHSWCNHYLTWQEIVNKNIDKTFILPPIQKLVSDKFYQNLDNFILTLNNNWNVILINKNEQSTTINPYVLKLEGAKKLLTNVELKKSIYDSINNIIKNELSELSSFNTNLIELTNFIKNQIVAIPQQPSPCYSFLDQKRIFNELGIIESENNLQLLRERYIDAENISPKKGIPYISHHVWTSNHKNPSKIPEVDIKITLQSIKKLDSTHTWQHLFWTNVKGYFPTEFVNAGMQLKIIQEEFSDLKFEKHLYLIEKLSISKYFTVSASDFARTLIIGEKGGVYMDFNYKVCKPIDNLMIKYDSIFGQESNEKGKYLLGNCFFAAFDHHPIILRLSQTILDNFNCVTQPNYLKNACSLADQVILTSGPSVVGHSYYKETADSNVPTKDVCYPSPFILSMPIAHKSRDGLLPKIQEDSYCTNIPEISYGNDKFGGDWWKDNFANRDLFMKLKASGELETCFHFPWLFDI